ncbi:hypothetical protein [Anaeromyxobacter terrae]|uniref:hypothetical protein n=1 Tax=Anaeromyxobacter terrae TaxID=2925406 RepID=UPI001F595533|nr:hypothetical protein [Anaeromyxobacter sp. SG22]
MSYHVTILRTHAGKQLPISREDVVGAVESRPDLQASPGDDGTLEITVKAGGEESRSWSGRTARFGLVIPTPTPCG